jgi:hypothetical protein
MTADIIDLGSRQQAKPSRGIPAQLFKPPLALPSTAIGRNERLRAERRGAWNKAEAATNYWRVMTDFYTVAHLAQREGVAEACRDHKRLDYSDHDLAVVRFRKATVAQLLTPAPSVEAVNWKRATFAKGDWKHSGEGNAEQIEASIKSDIAFLAAHPARQPVRRKPLTQR